jgi:hypothetical protein
MLPIVIPAALDIFKMIFSAIKKHKHPDAPDSEVQKTAVTATAAITGKSEDEINNLIATPIETQLSLFSETLPLQDAGSK